MMRVIGAPWGGVDFEHGVLRNSMGILNGRKAPFSLFRARNRSTTSIYQCLMIITLKESWNLHQVRGLGQQREDLPRSIKVKTDVGNYFCSTGATVGSAPYEVGD